MTKRITLSAIAACWMLCIGARDIYLSSTGSDAANGSDGFDGRQTSGLLVITGGNITFRNITFRGGKATAPGGAYYGTGANVSFNACDFYNNTAYKGGALYVEGNMAKLTMNDCLLTDNQTTTQSGTFDGNASGGALAIQGAPQVALRGCTLSGNASLGHGGALFVAGNVEKLLVQSSCIVGNMSGGRPGTFAYDGADSEILPCGRHKAHGGAMMINPSGKEDARYIFSNTTIAANSATQAGGVALMNNGSIESQQVVFVNCTITRNETWDNVGNCGGLCMSNNKFPLYIVNSIVEGNRSLGNNIWSDGSFGTTPVKAINSYVGYIFQYNDHNPANDKSEYVETVNAYVHTLPMANSILQSGIDTQMDCEGLCFPIATTAPALTMGQPELVEQMGGEPFDMNGQSVGTIIGAVQLKAGDQVPSRTNTIATPHVSLQTSVPLKKFGRRGLLLPGCRSLLIGQRDKLYTLDGIIINQ